MVGVAQEALEDYVGELSNMGVREIMGSRMKLEKDGGGTSEMSNYVAQWDNAKAEWKQRYGDLEGWDSYRNYLSSNAGRGQFGVMDSVKEQQFGSKYASLRDSFGYR